MSEPFFQRCVHGARGVRHAPIVPRCGDRCEWA
jgi:hypothetical protein